MSQTESKTPTDDELLPSLLSRGEAAKLLGVHHDTINRWARRGLLNPVKLPSGIARYRTAELLAIKKGISHGSA